MNALQENRCNLFQLYTWAVFPTRQYFTYELCYDLRGRGRGSINKKGGSQPLVGTLMIPTTQYYRYFGAIFSPLQWLFYSHILLVLFCVISKIRQKWWGIILQVSSWRWTLAPSLLLSLMLSLGEASYQVIKTLRKPMDSPTWERGSLWPIAC